MHLNTPHLSIKKEQNHHTQQTSHPCWISFFLPNCGWQSHAGTESINIPQVVLAVMIGQMLWFNHLPLSLIATGFRTCRRSIVDGGRDEWRRGKQASRQLIAGESEVNADQDMRSCWIRHEGWEGWIPRLWRSDAREVTALLRGRSRKRDARIQMTCLNLSDWNNENIWNGETMR
jgi:hypothetical protein